MCDPASGRGAHDHGYWTSRCADEESSLLAGHPCGNEVAPPQAAGGAGAERSVARQWAPAVGGAGVRPAVGGAGVRPADVDGAGPAEWGGPLLMPGGGDGAVVGPGVNGECRPLLGKAGGGAGAHLASGGVAHLPEWVDCREAAAHEGVGAGEGLEPRRDLRSEGCALIVALPPAPAPVCSRAGRSAVAGRPRRTAGNVGRAAGIASGPSGADGDP